MTAFADLIFKQHLGLPGGVQATTFFPNGYGASVVQSPYTYGGDSGLYELAVLRGSTKGWGLCYDTPVTDDVEGYLTPERVTELLAEIEALPSAEPAQ